MGEILNYPRDIWRRRYFVQESVEHQAKLELQTYHWLVEHYTQPGDLILDPMSGIGTVHYAATMGRNTIGVEIAPRFAELQEMNMGKLDETLGLNGSCLTLLGDCRRHLPLPNIVDFVQSAYTFNRIPTYWSYGLLADIVIFSPPYGDLWKTTAKTTFHEEKHLNIGYSDDAGNIGNITNYPLYLAAMQEVYSLCYQSLKPGGLMISITKDYVRNYQRVYISKDNVAKAIAAGFQLIDWHFRYTDPKIFQLQSRKRRDEKGIDLPELIIDYEDILVLQRNL